MDLTLLWVGLGMIAGGGLVSIYAESRKPRPATDAAPPSWDEIIRQALALLLTAVGQIVNGETIWHRIQGVGSAIAVIGLIVIVVWFIKDVIKLLPNTPISSPEPST
jgi:hypothetical protein